MQNDAIWIVNQDNDDQEIIAAILEKAKIPNEVKFFSDGKKLLEELDRVQHAPFIIMCDANLKGMDGFELREAMLKTPNIKFHSVPFIYWSETASAAQIKKGFDLRGHGFFIKESSFEKWKETFIQIILYWRKSKMPDKRDQKDHPL
jgi:CheY-like chemotaxis protein